MRFCVEVCARLYISGESCIGDWLVQTQLNALCLAWESAIYDVCSNATVSDQDMLCNVRMLYLV